jgi:hypothetical protein
MTGKASPDMSIMPDAPAGANRNISLTRSLRDLADFIDAHPELPELRAMAWVDQYLHPHRDARKELTAVANALGKAFAKEERHGSDVEISGRFGTVTLRAVAKVSELRDEPEPELDYEPIIGGRS